VNPRLDGSAVGSTKRNVTVPMSGVLRDRLIMISARLNLPLREVVLRLILIGLDTSQDLALTPKVVEGSVTTGKGI
jgi:hypothetical protein